MHNVLAACGRYAESSSLGAKPFFACHHFLLSVFEPQASHTRTCACWPGQLIAAASFSPDHGLHMPLPGMYFPFSMPCPELL
eukprot:1150168-Pelagomonas_calceolata.AAC.3